MESPPSSAAASVKASSPIDGAAACDPDGEWAMSPPFARSLSACGGVVWAGVREAERCELEAIGTVSIHTDGRPKLLMGLLYTPLPVMGVSLVLF